MSKIEQDQVATQKYRKDLLRDALLHYGKKKITVLQPWKEAFLVEEFWLRTVTAAAAKPVKQTHST